MTDETTGWRRVATLSEFPESGLLDVVVGRDLVLLVRRGADVSAFQGLCPHQFARLSEGAIEDELIRCPHHLARFRLSDGACAGGWALPPLRRYSVRLEGAAVLLRTPLSATP